MLRSPTEITPQPVVRLPTIPTAIQASLHIKLPHIRKMTIKRNSTTPSNTTIQCLAIGKPSIQKPTEVFRTRRWIHRHLLLPLTTIAHLLRTRTPTKEQVASMELP